MTDEEFKKQHQKNGKKKQIGTKETNKGNELSEKLSKLSKEQQDALLKLLER